MQYDVETGFYYLNSRYYDPVVGRFINLDNQLSGVGGDVLGYNMIAYCGNNPVNRADPSGHCSYDVVNGFQCDYEFIVNYKCDGCGDPYNCKICYLRIQYSICHSRYIEESMSMATKWAETATNTYNTIKQKKEGILEKKATYIKENPVFIVPEILYHTLEIMSAHKTVLKGAAWVVPKTAKGIYKVVAKTAELGINLYNTNEFFKKIKEAKDELISIFKE